MKYDHVGRPTNEEVSYRKKISFLKIIIPIIIIGILVFIVINNDLLKYLKDDTLSKNTSCKDGYHLEDDKCIREDEIDAVLLGDTNQDGNVDNNDLVIIKNIAVNNDVGEDVYTAADVNRDSNVDLFDYKLLSNYLNKNTSNDDIGKYVCPVDSELATYKLNDGKCLKKVILRDVNIKEYKVVFVSNGGSFSDSSDKSISKLIKENDKIILPTITRKGYSFKGWYLGNKKISDSYKVTKNLKLKAKWKVRSDKLVIVFDGNGGQILKRKGKTVSKLKLKKIYDTEYGNLPKARKVGYKFKGWYIKNKKITPSTKVYDEEIVKAKWQSNSYNIKLSSSHGTIEKKYIKVKYGSQVKKLPKLKSTKKLEFLGWYTSKDGKGRRVTNDTIFTSRRDITLYAYWSRN